jgi:isoleucyl-tRNA synthetase
MLGNLAGFDPATNSLLDADLTDLDRYALEVLGDLVARVRTAYDRFELHHVHRALVDYVTTHLSSFYLDVLKDRLYSDPTDAPRRRAAQTVLHTIVTTVARLSAPILCFTAEDIWQHVAKQDGDPESVHLLDMPAGRRISERSSLAADYATLLRYRELVSGALEPFRAAKHRSEDARVTIRPAAADADLLSRRAAELPDLFIVSQVAIGAAAGGDPEIEIAEAIGDRCERCWRTYEVMSTNPELCRRCADAVAAHLEAAS